MLYPSGRFSQLNTMRQVISNLINFVQTIKHKTVSLSKDQYPYSHFLNKKLEVHLKRRKKKMIIRVFH